MTASPTYQKRDSYHFSWKPPSRFTLVAIGLILGLVITSWSYLISISHGKTSIFSKKTAVRSGEFVSDLLGIGSDTWGRTDWNEILGLAADTLAMSVIAAVLASTAALVIVPFAARRSSKQTNRLVNLVFSGAARFVFIFTRAVPELLWALIVVFIISPGIIAGAVALAIHNFGVIGRLATDIVEDLEEAPITALQTSGASASQRYFTGVLPLVSRQLLTFLFYRWEVMIRATAVVGFVAASGIGYQLRLDMSFFRYAEVGQLLLVYIMIVWFIDFLSAMVRRSIK